MTDTALIESTDDLILALPRLAGRQLLALDLETEGLDPHRHRPLLLALGDDSQQLLVDCRQVDLSVLAPLLTGPALKCTHNGAFDLAMLRGVGLSVENVLDTMLFEQLLINGRPRTGLSLAYLADKYLGLALDKSERASFPRHQGSFSPAQVEYARRDILATYHVLLEQMPRLQEEGLGDAASVEGQAVPVFADLTFDGIYLDRQAWTEIVDETQAQRDQLRQQIDEQLKHVVDTDLFGQVSLNYESDAELGEALSRLVGKNIREINKSVLRGLGHEVGGMLLEYRERAKIVSSYGESFLGAIHQRTGRIHADFRQIGAPTGRVACSNPNLQNIPRGSRFRKCFCGPPGRKMVTADYAGCELRILAELSGDPAFLRTFQRGGDLHAIVATEIFGQPVSKTLHQDLRERAKAINFGLAYGMGAGGLAAVTGLSGGDAERMLGRYYQAYPRVRQYLEDSAIQALRRGYAQTIGGRRLHFPAGSEGENRAGLLRVAKNMPIQGTNADMLKVAMAGVRTRLRQEGLEALMVNCVHDEILIEAPAAGAWEVADMVREEMVRAGERYVTQVPTVVDVSVADSWQK